MMFDVEMIDRTRPVGELPLKASGMCDWCRYPGIELELILSHDRGCDFVGETNERVNYICDFCRQSVGMRIEDSMILAAQASYIANKLMATLMLVVKKERVTDPADPGIFVVGKISASRGFMLVGIDGRPFVCKAENQQKVFNEICNDASMYRVSHDGTHLSRVSLPQDPAVVPPPQLKVLTVAEREEVQRAISTLED